MADTPSVGSLAKFAVDSALPFDTNSKAFEIQLPETLKKREVIRRTDGLRGTRSRHSTRRRVETSAVSGTVTFQPGVAEFDFFLQYILGGSPSGGVTALAETVPAFWAMIDRVAKVFQYNSLYVNVARLTGAMGSPVTLSLDLEGISETITNAGTFPSITIPDEPQFIFPHATITLNGTAYPMKRFELVINNALETDRYMNATTRSAIPATDRTVTLALELGYTPDTTGLYDQAIAGFAGSLVLDDGTTDYTFAFANLHAPTDGPTVQNKQSIPYPLNYIAERTDSTRELIVTKA
jgi:hypothetical protein